MGPAGTIFAHEWAVFWRSGVLALMLLIVGAIGVAVAIAEHRAWTSEQAGREALQAQERAQWLALGHVHIHKAAHLGYFFVKDLPAGVILDRGVWDFGGSAVWLEAHRRNAPRLRAADHAVLLARGEPRGVGPVTLWLTTLLTAVLAHGVVAAERARGSLAFAVSSGASADAIVFGKALAVTTLAWAAATVPMVVGAALAAWSGLSVASAALWATMVFAALGIFATLTVVVSAIAPRPLSALVALLLIWFAMAVLWPRLTPGVTGLIAPTPSSQTLRSEAEVAAEGLSSEETQQAVRARLAADGVVEPNSSGVSALAAEIDAARTFADIFAPLEQGMARQADLSDRLAWLSPLMAADRAADGALNVSDRDQFAFEAQAEAMRFATQMALNEEWARKPGHAHGDATIWASVVEAADTVVEPRRGTSVAGYGLIFWAFACVAGLAASARSVRRSIR